MIGYFTLDVERLYRIVLLRFAHRNFILLSWLVEWEKLDFYWLHGTNVTDGLDGTGVVWRDQDQFHWLLRCGGQQKVADATTFIGISGGAEYLIHCRKIIITHCTQILTTI